MLIIREAFVLQIIILISIIMIKIKNKNHLVPRLFQDKDCEKIIKNMIG